MRIRALPVPLLLVAALAQPSPAQVISIRTVPISQSHQFDLFPSLRAGMGGVRIAVDDSLADPMVNPALGGRIGASRFFGSPGVYSVSSRAGAGRTLPVGAWLRSGRWFGTLAVAAQQVDLSESPNQLVDILPVCPACTAPGAPDIPTLDRTLGNAFLHGMVGTTLPGLGLSVGGSVSWAALHGVDGTDLLYPGTARLRQRGHSLDLRLGAHREWAGGQSLSAVLLHHRYGVSHDAWYLDPIWDPGSQSFSTRPRREPNLDHTRIWGLHFEHRLPLRSPGWQLGWAATTNLMSHPKIPNYEIQNIPRDPGNSEAFNLGVGISRTDRSSTFALDLVYEPIWSHTWAEAAGPVTTDGGATIPTGGRTIENRFRFSNATLRMGLAQDLAFRPGEPLTALGLQLGLAVHRIDYALRQDDNVQITTRHQSEDWIEWSPTWGLSLAFPSWELRYRGSAVNGTGRPGIASFPGPVLADAAGRQILVAPSGPLTLAGVKVMSHQVSVVFPFR